LLVPAEYGFGHASHRVPLETRYLEAYPRPNVEAVSVKDNPIERITAEGIQIADGKVYRSTSSNVPGKPRRGLSYTGGVGTYRQKYNEVAASGYEGFVIQ
jgi:hypothetical protein